jgi:hypothetical protein
MPISIHAANRAAPGCVKSGGMTTRIGGWLVFGRGFGHDREVLEGLTIDAADLSAGFLSNLTTAGPLRATTAKYPELSRAAAGVRASLGELGNFFANLFGGTCLWMSMTTGSWRQ